MRPGGAYLFSKTPIGCVPLVHRTLHKLPSFGKTKVGERYLSAAEIEEYLKATNSLPTIERIYFNLLMFYGARPGELAQWQWKWIRLDRIVIPGTFQKNGRALTLPITPHVRELLEKLRSVSGETEWLYRA